MKKYNPPIKIGKKEAGTILPNEITFKTYNDKELTFVMDKDLYQTQRFICELVTPDGEIYLIDRDAMISVMSWKPRLKQNELIETKTQ
jgi:hypothetical protein